MNQLIVVFKWVAVELKSFPLHQIIEAGFHMIYTTSANIYQKILFHQEEGGIQLFQADFAPPQLQAEKTWALWERSEYCFIQAIHTAYCAHRTQSSDVGNILSGFSECERDSSLSLPPSQIISGMTTSRSYLFDVPHIVSLWAEFQRVCTEKFKVWNFLRPY